MFLLPGLDQAGTQQRSGFQVEWLVRLAVRQLLQTLLAGGAVEGAEVLQDQAQAGLGGNPLTGHAIDAREGSAQGFMAQDQRLQGRLETGQVEHTPEARHAADVVGRAVRLHLPEEPHALLGIGQGHRPAAVDRQDRGLQVTATGTLDQPDLFGKGTQFAGLEQHP